MKGVRFLKVVFTKKIACENLNKICLFRVVFEIIKKIRKSYTNSLIIQIYGNIYSLNHIGNDYEQITAPLLACMITNQTFVQIISKPHERAPKLPGSEV